MILLDIFKNIDLTPNSQDLITAVFVGFLGLVGWLVKEQISTNKELAKAITATNASLSTTITNAVLEFKTAIQEFNARDKLQQQTCEYHRKTTDEIKLRVEAIQKHTDVEIRKMHAEIKNIKHEQ